MSFFGFSILDLKKTIHFTSIPFPWRPPCLLLRGYAVAVVWSGMCCEHIWCGGVVALFVALFVYIFGKWGKMVRKKLTLAYLVLIVGVELCLVVC